MRGGPEFKADGSSQVIGLPPFTLYKMSIQRARNIFISFTLAFCLSVTSCVPFRETEVVDAKSSLEPKISPAFINLKVEANPFESEEGIIFDSSPIKTSSTGFAKGQLDSFWLSDETKDVEPILAQAIPKYDLPQSKHPSVGKWIKFLQGRGREWFEIWLARSTRYVPLFYEVLEAYKLPKDLIFLAMVESGFSPRAFSSAAASGPWQFVPSTAKRYGLRVGFWVDERRDFHKSSEAAARHLKWLYSRYGDWHLAMAAYNAGAGRVSKALKRSRTKSFWKLYNSSYIRRQTKQYVPKILAASILSKAPEKYGFSSIRYQPLMRYDTIEVSVATSLATVGKACGGLSAEVLEELNPSLRVSVTPPSEVWPIRVPPGMAGACEQGLGALPEELQHTFRYYQTSYGESVEDIAKKFKTSPEAILEFHGVAKGETLGDYPEMAVPIKSQYAEEFAIILPKPRERSARYQASTARLVNYKVLRGDSLWSIARRYSTSIKVLQQLNGLKEGQNLIVGQMLRTR